MEITERADGVIELRPAPPVHADQAWFWSEHWQQREREFDEDVDAGRVTRFESTDEFVDYLSDPASRLHE